MGTSTPNLVLYKPDDGELVDVEVQLNDNMDKIDTGYNSLLLGSSLAYQKILGGKFLAANVTATSGGTEKQIFDTGAVSLPANSLIAVELVLSYDASLPGDDFDGIIRIDTIAGAVQKQSVAPRTDNAVPYQNRTMHLFKTTTATSKTFIGSIARIFGGGTATVTAGSYLAVGLVGPSSLLPDQA